MAVQEQVERLTRSVDEWNKWRRMQLNVSVDLGGANLARTQLWEANLSYADLSRTDLSNANLSHAILYGTNLSNANLSSALLTRTNLSRADLDGADFTNTRFWDTVFAHVDLSLVKGLDSAQYPGPSSIDINSVTLPRDEHTRLYFLRGIGFSDTLIEYLPSLLITPIQYHSLFISYSHHDQVFASYLHTHLQNQGVHCWFAPHDLRPGTPLVRGIEEAIHVHEKLLLILSHHAVNSPWVQQEVEAALYKETISGQEMLFPIRLDNTVLESETLWAKRLCQRHIGDFTGWQDDTAYQQVFTGLLRHLIKA